MKERRQFNSLKAATTYYIFKVQKDAIWQIYFMFKCLTKINIVFN